MVTLLAVLGAISFVLWLVALGVLAVIYRKMGGPALMRESHGLDLKAMRAQSATPAKR